MDNSQYQVLVERIDQIQKVVDQIDDDLSKDRADLQEFRLELSAVKDGLSELRKQSNRTADKIQDRMSDVVEPLMDQIEDKKIIIVKEKNWKQKLQSLIKRG